MISIRSIYIIYYSFLSLIGLFTLIDLNKMSLELKSEYDFKIEILKKLGSRLLFNTELHFIFSLIIMCHIYMRLNKSQKIFEFEFALLIIYYLLHFLLFNYVCNLLTLQGIIFALSESLK